jgi:hypothetical protein
MIAVASCIGCGCDDFHACEDGCHWLRVDYDEQKGVCNQCENLVEAWDRGDRTSHATPAAELEAAADGRIRIPRPEQPRPAGIESAACREVTRNGRKVHVMPSGNCPHDWPFEDVRDSDQCRWCGMSFTRHVFTECP